MEIMIDIKLTALRQMFYRIDSTILLEMDVIKNFSIKQTLENNTFNKVMQIALNHKYSTVDKVYKYSSLSIFYSPSKFLNAFKSFYDMLVTFISRKVDPYYDDIRYVSIVEDDGELIVKFCVSYIGDGHVSD